MAIPGQIIHSAGVQNLRPTAFLPALAGCLLAACASHPAAPAGPAGGAAAGAAASARAPARSSQDTGALTVVAEIALKQGDCRTAAESYARAAAAGGAPLARRASQVGLACEHLPAAWESANRWRKLAPGDRDAAALYAAVALKLYRLPDAQAAIADFWRLSSSAAAAPPAKAGQGAAPTPPEGALAELAALLVEQADATAVLAALSPALEPTHPAPATLALLAGLSLDGFDGQRALRYAQAALERSPQEHAAQRVLARAYVMRGEPARAIEAARAVMQADPHRSAFELAEIYAALDRFEDAHQELERVRAAQGPGPEVDRRLALLALQSGDLKEARQRFEQIAAGTEGGEAIALSLAEIDARSGHPDAAIAAYRRLYDSPVAVAARSRAAGLLMARGDRREAVLLLDDYVSEHPESEFELTLAKAHLLAQHGEAPQAVALLEQALQRHPQHPTLEYERAVALEQSGRVQESISALEALLARRPEDPTLLNALGYTLADHNMQLAKAESCIRRALAITPDSPAALDSLGWVRYRAGDAHGAAATLERAYSIGHDGEIAAHWGEALWASGAQGEARKVWAAALARDPQSEPLKATLARFIPPDAPRDAPADAR